MSPGKSAMENEFDVVAGWTLAAIRELGPDHAIPGACRGTSSPAMLTWLAGNCALAAGQMLLDVGGGMGGPAAYAARERGVRSVVADPMPRACRAAQQLFTIGSVVAAGDRLPLADGRMEGVWCLGVLCSIADKAATLAEIRRVTRPGGMLGLMVVTADQPRPPGSPQGNVFPRHEELEPLLSDAGFDLFAETSTADLDDAPRAWTRRLEEIKDLVRAQHSDDPRMSIADDQEARMSKLFDTGLITTWLMCAKAR